MKISKRFRKLVAAVMVALIINIAIISPVLEVKASDIPAEATAGVYPIVQALLEILGIANGLGVSYEGMSGTSSDMAQEMIDKWTAGESLQMGDQTIPDLRDVNNMADFLYNLKLVYDAHIDGSNPISYLEKMDAKSYAASGSLYSKTMQFALALALENLSEETNTAFWNLILNDSTENLNNQFNFKTTALLFDALVAGQAAYAGDVSDAWLTPVSTSEWNSDDVFGMSFEYEGMTIPVYKTSVVDVYNSSNTDLISKYSLTGEAYAVFIKYSSQSVRHIFVSPNTFTVDYYSSNGNYSRSLTTSISGSYYYATEGKMLIPINYSYVECAYSTAIIDALIAAIENGLGSFNYANNASAIDSAVTTAISGYGAKRVTGIDAVNLANDLVGVAGSVAGTLAGVSTIADSISGTAATLPDVEVDAGTGEYSGILGKIYSLIQNLAASIWSYFSTPLTNLKDVISTIPALIAVEFAGILTIPQILIDDLSIPITDIRENVQAITDSITAVDAAEPNNGHSTDYTILLSSLFLLIAILIKLLMIFFHCMEFIIAIFAIPAGTAFLPEEMIMGLDYTKSLTIPGIGMSVYGFMIGLVYICIVFYVIRTLRMNIDKIKMPGRK